MYGENINSLVMQEYEKIRSENTRRREDNIRRVYEHIPRIKEIDDELNKAGLQSCKQVINGTSAEEAIRIMREKVEKLTLEKSQLLAKKGIPPRFMAENFKCRKCKDRGFVNGEKCSCYYDKAYKIMRKMSNLNCPEDHNFDNYDLSLYEKKVSEEHGITPYANAKSNLDMAKAYVKGGKKIPKHMLLYGATGLGKTYTSDCIANEFLKQGRTVFYMSAPRLFKIFEDYRFGRSTNDSAEMAMDAVETAELLIIDDLGTEFRTQYTESILFDIINSRLNTDKNMIISTNLTTDQIANTYSDRISSRIIGGFSKILFFGSDIRILKNN